MAKDKLTDYDSTAANNLDVGGISVAEGMLPSGVNNAIRELMSHQAEAFGAGTPLYVDQTNNRLGIGNAAPTVPLDVTGAAVVSGDLTVDTSTLKVDSTNNRVGIVNASPTTALDVTGDITVSGGVYLGGTGSANYLDDYEEGTWTPVVQGSSTAGSYTITTSGTARYVKVGNLATVFASINNITEGTAGSGYLQIAGLPFTKPAATYASGSVGVSNGNLGFTPASLQVEFTSTSTTSNVVYLYVHKDNATSVNFDLGDIVSGTTDIRFSITYKTT